MTNALLITLVILLVVLLVSMTRQHRATISFINMRYHALEDALKSIKQEVKKLGQLRGKQ